MEIDNRKLGEDDLNLKILKLSGCQLVIPNVKKDKLISFVAENSEKIGKGTTRDNPSLRIYLCKVCGKKSRDTNSNRDHMETHIEGLHFSCSGCQLMSRSRSAIRCHIAKKKKFFKHEVSGSQKNSIDLKNESYEPKLSDVDDDMFSISKYVKD